LKKIKLLHLISNLSVGGSEIILWRLLERMDGARFTNAVVCMTGTGAVADRIRALGIPVYSLGMKRNWPTPIDRDPALIARGAAGHPFNNNLRTSWITGGKNLGYRESCGILAVRSWTRPYGRLTAMVVALTAKLSGFQIRSSSTRMPAGISSSIGYGPKRWKSSERIRSLMFKRTKGPGPVA
jgi:hypothetical protein